MFGVGEDGEGSGVENGEVWGEVYPGAAAAVFGLLVGELEGGGEFEDADEGGFEAGGFVVEAPADDDGDKFTRRGIWVPVGTCR